MTDSLIEQLRRSRKDYKAESLWHRFLIDAYTGGGGFESPSVVQPESGYWGPIAELYAAAAFATDVIRGGLTYLDRHPREDDGKFQARRQVAHYLNYVEPLTDLKVSYLLRKEFARESEPDVLEKWRADMDGEGAKWADVRPGVVIAAALLGWCPVLVDRPVTPDGISRAHAESQNLDRSIIIPYAPSNLVDWDWKDGRFAWVKTRTCHVDKSSWSSEPVTVEEITVWTDRSANRWEIRRNTAGDEQATHVGEFPHAFGRPPFAIFRHKRTPGRTKAVGGLPMHAAISAESRRLYNLTSEMDEHVRGQVFALLVLAQLQQPSTGDKELGTQNGLLVGPDQKNIHYFLAPPASVAATLEKRMEGSIQEIFRMARVEFSRPVGSTTSGVARAYEFEGTNRAIADFASEVARGELDLEQLVGRGEGIAEEKLAKMAVLAPQDFGVEDFKSEVESALLAVSMKLGPTAETEIKKRIVQRALPQLPAEKMANVERELEVIAKEPAPAPPAPPAPPKNGPPAPPAKQPPAPGA